MPSSMRACGLRYERERRLTALRRRAHYKGAATAERTQGSEGCKGGRFETKLRARRLEEEAKLAAVVLLVGLMHHH